MTIDDEEGQDQVANDFFMLVGEVQANELVQEAKRFEEEKRLAEELRKANSPKAMTASQLLGHKTKQELDQDFDSLMQAEEKKAAAIATKHEEDRVKEQLKEQLKEQQASGAFPAPTITTE